MTYNEFRKSVLDTALALGCDAGSRPACEIAAIVFSQVRGELFSTSGAHGLCETLRSEYGRR